MDIRKIRQVPVRAKRESQFVCKQCMRCFRRASQLERHRKTHTAERNVSRLCELCNKSFTRVDGLRKHMRTHTGEKPYPCPHCDRCFADSATLVRHTRIHTGEKPYACPHCDKTFAQVSARNYHAGTHIEKKSFVCHLCQKEFCRNNGLQIHLKTCAGPAEVSGPKKKKTVGDVKPVNLPDSAAFPRIPPHEVCVDDSSMFVEQTDGFRAGYYGGSPVTLALLPAVETFCVLPFSQPCLHPGIAASFGLTFVGDSKVTLVMENIETSLSQLLADVGDDLSVRERIDIAVGCMCAVDYLHHQLRISHGMLTTDYIFCSSSLSVKILDPFAVALISGEDGHLSGTQQDDFRQLGGILVSLFQGIFADIDSNPCDDSGEYRLDMGCLHTALLGMTDKSGVDFDANEVMTLLERIRETDQYKGCQSKRHLSMQRKSCTPDAEQV